MKNSRSAVARANQVALLLFTVLTSIIALAYIVQVIKGEMGMNQFLPIILSDLIPMLACWYFFKRDEESPIVKHVMGCGYGLFYAVVCFTTSNTILVFVYAIPAVIFVSLFNDFRFSVFIGIGVSTIATIHAIKFAASLNWEGGAVADLEIEVLIMIVASVFSIVVNKVIAETNANQLELVNESSAKTEKMLKDVMDISAELIDDVNAVSAKMSVLSQSSADTLSAMQEVQSGTTDSAESIQNQLVKTEEIQTQIDNVTGTADSIGTSVAEAVEAIHEGRDNIGKLIEQSKVSEEAGNSVVSEVEGLKGSTEQMETIVELIKNVASQTSLLALNASIEAARAGEAGRGFAVVATEISNLAAQTQNATGNISDLIAGISSEIEKVVDAINSLVESNRIQNESANVTAGSFDKIVESTRTIRSKSTELTDIVSKLAKANGEIVESIQTISAITEEVSAHSTTTCETSEDNRQTVSEVQTIVEDMIKNADRLKNI